MNTKAILAVILICVTACAPRGVPPAFIAPQNDLEHALIASAMRGEMTPELRRRLLSDRLYIRVRDAESLARDDTVSVFLMTGPDGTLFVPVYTSRDRLREVFSSGTVSYVAYGNGDVFDFLLGDEIILNYGLLPDVRFYEANVADLAAEARSRREADR